MKTLPPLVLVAIAFSLPLGCEKNDVKDAQNNSASSSVPASISMLGDLEVTDVEGNRRMVKEYIQDKNLVLVVSRGYFGAVCPFCSAQVQRLASQHQKIEEAGGKVLIVFPVDKFTDFQHRESLVQSARSGLAEAADELPFEIVSDPELRVVDQLDIRDELSKPATYILDESGKVRYAYIGRDPGDRPRIETIVQQLQSLNS